MSTRVFSRAAYLTTTDVEWRDEDYAAMNFIRAIKGDPLKSTAKIPVGGGVMRRLAENNRHEADGMFAQWAAGKLKEVGKPPFILVPIPGSEVVKGYNGEHRTLRLARAIAKAYGAGATVADAIRWKKQLVKSRKGGPRDAKMIYDNTIATDGLKAQGATCVIVDDVCTGGGHIRAVAAALSDSGWTVGSAVCAGQSTHDQNPDPFNIAPTDLHDFDPKDFFTWG